jgi:hypothetical protein
MFQHSNISQGHQFLYRFLEIVNVKDILYWILKMKMNLEAD